MSSYSILASCGASFSLMELRCAPVIDGGGAGPGNKIGVKSGYTLPFF